MLADGLRVGESKTVDATGYADVFFNMGASFQTIINNYGVKITPTYFVPLVYVPKTKASASITTTENGLIKGEAEANVDIYTAVNMHDFMEDKKTIDNLDLNASRILSNGGFDLSLELERNWFHNFNAGLYTRIPVLPGKLNYKMSTRVWANFYEANVLGYLDNTESHTSDHGHDDFTYSEETHKAYRPLRLGLNATYMPFGNWLKIQPLLWRIFNFNVGTAYQNQVFQHRAGFSLNFRAVEILAQASLCGTNLPASFKRDGYGAFVGVRMGF